MFAYLEKPTEDELYASWINEMLEANGAKDRQDKEGYLNRMMGETAGRIRFFEDCRYFPDAEELCNAERRSNIFPNVMEIISRHSDIYAMLSLTAKDEQVKRTEYCLHGISGRPGIRIRYLYNQKLKICPQCLKEDMEKYGRKIIHVPHQLYVNACWKHGCKLTDDAENPSFKEEQASKQDIEKAVFMHDLYMDPAITNFKLTEEAVDRELERRGMSRQEAQEQSADEGYTQRNVPSSFFTGKSRVQISSEFYDFYIGILTWMFHTADNFKSCLHSWNPADEYDKDDFKLLEMNGVLGKFRCRTCGHEFYMHPCGAEYGMPCPKCIDKMSDVQICQRYADYLDDGEYDITEENGKIRVIHRECGTDRSRKFFSIVCNRTACPVCREKHDREGHIGEKIGGTEIIDYKNADDVTVRLVDGEVVEHRNYFYVKRGIETNTRKHMGEVNVKAQLRKDRIGETRENYQGIDMTITNYRNARDIDIRFENGDTVTNRKYEDFLKGRIRCPLLVRGQRIGEANVNGHGEHMTIIGYENTDNITVQFDDGETVVTSYYKFQHGLVGCPSHTENVARQRIGETNINNRGQKMTIIAYRSASDIDIRFDDTGEIARHKDYHHFKDGEIAPSKKK